MHGQNKPKMTKMTELIANNMNSNSNSNNSNNNNYKKKCHSIIMPIWRSNTALPFTSTTYPILYIADNIIYLSNKYCLCYNHRNYCRHSASRCDCQIESYVFGGLTWLSCHFHDDATVQCDIDCLSMVIHSFRLKFNMNGVLTDLYEINRFNFHQN